MSVAGELLLVMEYVPGESLSRLLSKSATQETRVPPRIAAAVVCDVLEGLHADREAQYAREEPLPLGHRDVLQHVLPPAPLRQ